MAESFEAALRVMIAAQLRKVPQGVAFAEATPLRPPAFFFRAGEALAKFGYPGEQEYSFPSSAAIYIRIFPTYGDQPRVGLSKLKTIFDARKPCPMSLTIGGLAARNSYGSIILDPSSSTTTDAITQGFETGELWGVNAQVFRTVSKHPGLSGGTETLQAIPSITLEKIYARTLENYVRILFDEMNLRLPYTIELGATGLKECRLAVPTGGVFGRGEYVGLMMSDNINKRYELNNTNAGTIEAILRSYFTDFYDLAACLRDKVLTDELITANGLPSRRAL